MIPDDARALVLSVRLLDGRYHGEPEWPPAPARLFQALVAGSAKAGRLEADDHAALEWLESSAPPIIAAPIAWSGQPVKLWVPNNDMDGKSGGDPTDVAALRTGKRVRPRIFDRDAPLLYVWRLVSPESEPVAVRVCEMACGLYQLGRGVDMASATGRVLGADALERLLRAYAGTIHRPSERGASKLTLATPQPGSLASLAARHDATLGRFATVGKGRKSVDLFRQPPKPRFAHVAYDVPVDRALFDLRPVEQMAAFSATPLARIGPLTEALRDAAAARLAGTVEGMADDVERGLVGRRVEGRAPVRPEQRVRITPLPSIGHEYADCAIRRVLVDVPSGNPLRADDVFWAFSGLTFETPVGATALVTRADDRGMLAHYGANDEVGWKRWRTVTAAALPVARRRIEPSRMHAEAKPAAERADEEARAAQAVVAALRHAGVRVPVDRVQVQREPYTAKGARAEHFAPGTRFPKERLWHVDVTFRGPVEGPLVLGDGRFLGLGLMAPVEEAPMALAFRVTEGLAPEAPAMLVAEALRRAVMARCQATIGAKERLPSFMTGHQADGRPAEGAPHLSFVYDAEDERLLVVAPHALARRSAKARERAHLDLVERALEGFRTLRAGRAGRLSLEPVALAVDDDPLLAQSCRWVSRTPYAVNRHANLGSAPAALAADLDASLRTAGLPNARVRVHRAWTETGGLVGMAELDFEVAIGGPLMLGRTRHKGGGLFGHALRT